MDTLPLFGLNDNTLDKFCKGCEQFYPPTLEFFPPEKKGKNGLSSRCRICARKKQKRHRNKPEKREHHLAYMKEWHSENKEQQRAYYSRPEIRQRANAYQKSYAKRPYAQSRIKAYYHRQDVRFRMSAFYDTPEQRERKRLRMQAYNSRPDIQIHRHAYTAMYYQRPGVKEHRQAWHQSRYKLPETKARMSAIRHRRRARLKNATGSHTPEQLLEQYTRQKGKCYYCQKKVAWGQHHIDHVVPLSRGGSNDISNLVATCPHCNLSKHDKLPHEFFQGGRLL